MITWGYVRGSSRMGEGIEPSAQAKPSNPATSEGHDETTPEAGEQTEDAGTESPAAQRRARLRKEIRAGMQRALNRE